MDALLIASVGGRRIGVPVAHVIQVLRAVEVTPLPNAPRVAAGIINVRGELLAVIDVRRRFELPDAEITPDDRLVLVRTRRRRIALLVDSVQGLIDRPRTSIVDTGVVLPGVPQICGLAALEDGVLAVTDLDAFLSLDEETSLDDGVRSIHAGSDAHAR